MLFASFRGGSVVEVLFDIEGAGIVVSQDLIVLLVPFGIAVLVTVDLQELVHGLAFRLLRYDVISGFSCGRGRSTPLPRNRSRSAWTSSSSRSHAITFLAVPLLALPPPFLAVTGYLVLVLETSGAIGDLALLVQLWLMPAGALLYDLDVEHKYAFQPGRFSTTSGCLNPSKQLRVSFVLQYPQRSMATHLIRPHQRVSGHSPR